MECYYFSEKECSYQNHVVSSIITGRGEIIIKPVGMGRKAVKVVLLPLPDIAKHIMETKFVGREHVNRLKHGWQVVSTLLYIR